MEESVRPYDETTLFCPSGMQQFKDRYKDQTYFGTESNIQSCIRLNDLSEIGDGTHLLFFNMIGLFSFRELSLQDSINFCFEFLLEIGVKPDYVTIHPDKKEWIKLYDNFNIEIREDNECVWTDGDITGYCTEFYKDDIEIGNIVNTLDTCIDVGFGLERILFILNKEIQQPIDILKESILKIIDSGYKPSHTKQGYVLKKLLRSLYQLGGELDHEYFIQEITRQKRLESKWLRLKDKIEHRDKEWWFNTHGINLEDFE